MDLTAKITIFCRELGESTLQDLARQKNKEELLQHALDALKAGQTGPALEADLDALDAMVRQEYGQGLFAVTRSFTPLPGYPAGTGAQWWTCPRGRCAGRGRVLPGQQPPQCAAVGEQLVPGPLPQ